MLFLLLMLCIYITVGSIIFIIASLKDKEANADYKIVLSLFWPVFLFVIASITPFLIVASFSNDNEVTLNAKAKKRKRRMYHGFRYKHF